MNRAKCEVVAVRRNRAFIANGSVISMTSMAAKRIAYSTGLNLGRVSQWDA